MNRFFGSVLAFAAVVGCAHKDTTSFEVVPSQTSGVYLKEGERAPASAPQIEWVRGSLSFNVTGAVPEGSVTQEVKVNQEMIWMETEYFTDTRSEEKDFVVPGTCSDFKCSAGAGKSELWDAFYSATGEKKAAALDQAISGIGIVSAKNLVAKGYFKSKPRSWDEFTREIQTAASGDVIKKSVATMVVENNRYENITKLGYGSNSCQEVKRTCDLYITKIVQVPFQNTREVPRRRIVETKTFNVTVNVSGSVLLPDEKDTLAIKVDQNGKVVDLESSGYNNYAIASESVTGQNVKVEVKAVSRILRPLSNNMIRQESYVLVAGKPTFILDIDPAMIPGKEDPNAQLVLDYTVEVCEYGWTGTCGWSEWKKSKMTSSVINAARTTIVTDVPRKHKSQIQYRVTRKNSIYFDSKGLNERETDEIKMPK
ncbi:hypothetical protein ACLVWU_01665 [Bdellovibrio sp. HCB290]|uniref:hypothetical protein n=1 Tax=Bdellovibrio sp. HCB290 TaxID=3394356 RepID=UPI0039B5340B